MIEDMFEDQVVVFTVAKIPDAYGSYTEVKTPETFLVSGSMISGLDCAIWGLDGYEIDEYQKKGVQADYGFICAPLSGLAIKEMDTMTQVSRLSKEFDIVWVDELIAKNKYIHLALLEKKAGA